MDEQLFFIINGTHTAFLDGFMYLVSQKAVWVPLYLSLLYVIWRNYSWRGIVAVLLMIGVGMLFTDWMNAHMLRPWIGRLRPSNPDNPIAPLVHIVNNRRGSGCGFPSAHSGNIWMLTFAVAYWLRDKVVATSMGVVALVVCYSRVYLGYHYPGDILGGFVLALLTFCLLTWIYQRYIRRSGLWYVFPKETVMTVRQSAVPAITAIGTFAAFVVAACVS